MAEDKQNETPVEDEAPVEEAPAEDTSVDEEELEEKGMVEEILSDPASYEDDMVFGDQEKSPQEEFQEVYDDLEEEFGDVTDLLIDVYYDPRVRKFLLEHHERIAEINRERGGKARFYFHREPTDEIYLLLSPRPSEFNTAWLSMRTPEYAVQAFEKFSDGLLRVVMEYPEYDDVDWDLDGSGVYAPMGLTKSRLIDTFFEHELIDRDEQNTAAFGGEDVDDAVEVANRRNRRTEKPSL